MQTRMVAFSVSNQKGIIPNWAKIQVLKRFSDFAIVLAMSVIGTIIYQKPDTLLSTIIVLVSCTYYLMVS